jgi:hypothetical protein
MADFSDMDVLHPVQATALFTDEELKRTKWVNRMHP